MKVDANRGTLIAAVLLGAAAAAYVFFFFLPGSRAMTAMVAEMNEKQAFILEAQNSQRLCVELERELAECETYNATHARQIVRREDLPQLYSKLSQLAKTHKLATPKFEPRPEVAYETFRKITVALGIEGPLAAIHRMLNDLEALPEQVWVTDIKLHAPRQAGGLVECELSLVVFIDNPGIND